MLISRMSLCIRSRTRFNLYTEEWNEVLPAQADSRWPLSAADMTWKIPMGQERLKVQCAAAILKLRNTHMKWWNSFLWIVEVFWSKYFTGVDHLDLCWCNQGAVLGVLSIAGLLWDFIAELPQFYNVSFFFLYIVGVVIASWNNFHQSIDKNLSFPTMFCVSTNLDSGELNTLTGLRSYDYMIYWC